MKTYYVYLLASKNNGVLYTGVTNDLRRRIQEHKQRTNSSFTKKYFIMKLVWFDHTDSIEAALNREKQIKKWKRAWKIELIEKSNPNWNDLSDTI